MSKPILALDFDGVLHRYSKGWQDGSIYDEPTPGAVEFVREAVKHFTVVVVSSRLTEPDGYDAIWNWLRRYGFPPVMTLSHKRPPAFVTLDDRALTFEGTWPSMEHLQDFKPWTQRDA